MLRIILVLIVLFTMGLALSCGSADTAGGGTPTEAYKLLYAAVKTKDIETIKKHLSKKTIEFGAMAASRGGTPVEKMYENGFTSTTFSASMPTIRDERVRDEMGSVEVWNSEKGIWEDLPFVKEEGYWKLAIGDLFAGSFKSPGKGRDEKEKEAANVMSSPMSPPESNSRTNVNIPIVKDIPVGPQSKKNTQ